MRKDLLIKSVRGNVNRRLEKLDAGEYDALCLAVAGLKRLGLTDRITEYFAPSGFIPSPGQGALAVVTRKDNTALNKILTKLNHAPSVAAVTAERAFSEKTQGGCSMPVGAYAEIKKQKLILYGMLGSEDGRYILKAAISGNKNSPKILAEILATKLLRKASPWFHKGKIILTRETQDNKELAEKLKELGFSSFSFPSIKVINNLTTTQFKNYFNYSFSYDWLIFTSRNGVKFFMKNFKTAGLTHDILKNTQIAAVGAKTAEIAKAYELPVAFIPEKFTALALAKAMKNLMGKKILLARSSLGRKEIKKLLEQKNASVTDMPIYRTEFMKKSNKKFEDLLSNNLVLCLTFTSPSTIDGFFKNLPADWHKKILLLPVLSIGPVTSKAAQKYGFTRIYTADNHTVEGMLSKLKEINL